METKRLKKTKAIAKFIVGTSTAWTVGSVIAHNVSPRKRHQKVEAIVGGAVCGAMVADQAEAWTDRKIDEIADAFAQIKHPFKN
jgi:hypothetical protein